MKNYKLLPLTILMLSGLLAGVTAVRADDSGIVILSAKNDMPPNWAPGSWGGLPIETSPQGGRNPDSGYVGSTVDAAAKSYSGLSLGVGLNLDLQANCLPLTSDLTSNGVIEMYLSCGKPWPGVGSSGAHVKIIVMFATKDGKAVGASDDDIPALDGDPKTWTLVRVPLAQMVGKLPDAKAVVGLSAVSVQYVGQPTCEVRVTECYLKSK
jgi:hypothetical protein